MPNSCCSVCDAVCHMSHRDWSGTAFFMPLACSKECVFEWIRAGYPSQDLAELGAVKQVPDKADIAYSRKTGEFFRSAWEKAVAECLIGEGIDFRYEQWVFPVGHAHYIPDFYLPNHHCFLEVKGLWGTGSKSKLLRFTNAYTTIPILLIPWFLRNKFGYKRNVPDIQ